MRRAIHGPEPLLWAPVVVIPNVSAFETIKAPTRCALAGFDAVIDVRSPSEYQADHIPGAINLAVLSDQERAEVGTIYVQDSRFEARRLGAAFVSKNIAEHLTGALADRPRDFRPLIYCWRGGMRSNSMATILSAIGWRGGVLAGGYQSWRRQVVAELRDAGPPLNLIVLDGQTGSGKTQILDLLSQRGVQTLDLEGLANHRGSVFGGYDDAPQPSQKFFESLIWDRLSGFSPTNPTVVEAESNLIGRLSLPDRLMESMKISPRLEVQASLQQRARYLLETYGDIIAVPDRLACAIERLRPFHARSSVDAWLHLAQMGHCQELASELMEQHYDPLYDRQRGKRKDGPLAVFRADNLHCAGLTSVADQMTEFLTGRSAATAELSVGM